MPISNYTILRALAIGGKGSERSTVLRTLEPFNLFAFVIHDPEMHSEFDKKLNLLFDQLDFITGSKLLFFALVDPPTQWLSHARDREYYKHLGVWQTQELLNPKNSITSTDAGTTAFTLANSLHIPSEMLPCIVVVKNFDSNISRWFRTCPEHLEEQLKRLGYNAKRGGNNLSFLPELEIDLCRGSGSESLESSLAKALADVLSFIVSENSSDSSQRSMALKQAQNTVSDLYTKLALLKKNFDGSQIEEIDKLCVSTVAFLSLLNTQKNLNLNEFVPINKALLEADSYQILRTAHKVFNLLMSGQVASLTDDNSNASLDFTPVVICLAKVFEKEVNLSIVHWMRQELGVALPQFFNKPQPSVQATYVPHIPNARLIDFNAKLRGKWKAPGIGESEIACREYAQGRPIHGWNGSDWNTLLHHWRVIREKRNEAAHIEVVDEAVLLTVKRSLEGLAASQAFERFCKMKMQYSSGR